MVVWLWKGKLEGQEVVQHFLACRGSGWAYTRLQSNTGASQVPVKAAFCMLGQAMQWQYTVLCSKVAGLHAVAAVCQVGLMEKSIQSAFQG